MLAGWLFLLLRYRNILNAVIDRKLHIEKLELNDK